MNASIEANARTVEQHYDSLFGLVDRAKAFEAEGFRRRPPIVNMGYWLHGARTAREAQEALVREVASRGGDLRDRRVLDVGCGVGGPATMLACDYGAEVDAINVVRQQIEWARRFVEANALTDRVHVHLANAMSCPFPDGSFDVVFCLEAAHCFIDKPRFLHECRRLLRENGTLLLADIVGTSHMPVVNWQPALKLNLITAADWRRMLLSAGFVVQEQEMIGQAVYPGCRWWAKQTAPDKRRAIFEKSCKPDARASVKRIMRLRASLLEVLYFRSVLMVLSWLRLRDFVLFAAKKRA